MILRNISVLDGSKNGTFKNIRSNRLKEISEVCALYLAKKWNNKIIENIDF